MGDNQNWNNTGEQIKGALAEALRSGDFHNLNALVSQTATSVLDEVGIHIPPDGGGAVNRTPPPAWRQTDTAGTQQPGGGPAQPAWGDPKGPAAGGGQTVPVWQPAKPQSAQPVRQPGMGEPQTKAMQPVWKQTKQESAQPVRQPGMDGPQEARGQQPGAQQTWQQVKAQAQQTWQHAGMQAQQTWQHVKTQARPIWQQPGAQQTWQNPVLHPAWQNGQQNLPQGRQAANLSFVNMKKVGNVSGVLYQVFGGIGLGITGFVTFVRLFAFASGDTTVQGWIVNFIFLAVFFGLVRLGIGQRRRLRRARRYVSLCDNRMFGEVSYLAKNTGRSEDYVAKDLGKMLQAGIFPEGHLDDNKTCFMLNDTVYRQYLKAEDGRRLREEAERIPAERNESKHNQGKAEDGLQDSELNTMIAEGMECIRRLRDLNDRISGDKISARLFCLENLLKNIFDSIREHPGQMHQMHKLMDYYLPTTLKLVEAYAEFDQVSAPGEEITEAKAEIENTLDIINQAFTELLNNLFQDAVFDATTDAQVLKTMLAREGLTREMEFATVSRER